MASAIYKRAHRWMYKNYGKANHCENPECSGKSKTFNWAMIHGHEFELKRESWKSLCISCHQKYDNQFDKWVNEFGLEKAQEMKNEINKKRSLALIGKPKTPEHNLKNSLGRTGSKEINGHYVH